MSGGGAVDSVPVGSSSMNGLMPSSRRWTRVLRLRARDARQSVSAERTAQKQKARRCRRAFVFFHRVEDVSVFGRPGSDLLFQALRLSIIGAGEFNGRVRDGIGFRPPASTTRSAKNGKRTCCTRGRSSRTSIGPRAQKFMKQAVSFTCVPLVAGTHAAQNLVSRIDAH